MSQQQPDSPSAPDAPQDDDRGTTDDPGLPSPAAVTATGLRAAGPDGPVFGPLNLRIARGGLHILQGPSGSGRTTLLLALAGRFKVDGGTLDVLGRTRPAAVRGLCAIAGFRGIDDIDGSVRIRTVVHEQLAWNTPWYRRAPRMGDEAYEGTLRPVYGDLPLPSSATRVEDLGELDRMLLRIALAAAPAVHDRCVAPRVLFVDDIEQVRARDEQETLVRRLADVGRRATVIASAIDPLRDPAPPHSLYPLQSTEPGSPEPLKGA
ncbi:ATP-binding cassette domain-containing protein [Tomitella cavernea]|uniref:ATP-binding cassette domain-containing protein n=1 Tax=Tomitella cavernea TaxID=1387982 RepID=A0ABP9CXH4_9ACTN|nr:hypothetical protein [Tomitella cavernea]